MRHLHLLNYTMFAFLLGSMAGFASDALAVNSEHPLNTDHSRANTTASSPSDEHQVQPGVTTELDAAPAHPVLNGTTAAAEGADAVTPGHAHRAELPAPASASGMGATDNTMSSSTGSEGITHPSDK